MAINDELLHATKGKSESDGDDFENPLSRILDLPKIVGFQQHSDSDSDSNSDTSLVPFFL